MTFPSKVYIFLHENIFTKKNMLSHYVSLKLNNIEKKLLLLYNTNRNSKKKLIFQNSSAQFLSYS